MYPILKRISITEKAVVAKDSFSNEEISGSAKTSFICCTCGKANPIEIVPYQTGFPIIQIYQEDQVLSKSELVQAGAVRETANNMLHFGALTVSNLPTLYFGTNCSSCHSNYIVVFGYGEKQPGLTVLSISGVWSYREMV
ncbi:hypothetical protein [Chryseobacterium pennipullorum]|uniref:Uncharacterized protein n=1 Tax=Chryseobacterium pennipullorum TaxID=2258963 RepID=A0A3D9ANI6_9FLAO|nr:hypothetical protein [Chryseobacterium pennipullorum]REC42899.1 hypothetical protein DRF67_20070 [Chryseobacterium pennipullorum]